MARYLVTGGAGFIGSNIVRELVQRQEEVVVLDNFSTSKQENLADVIQNITLVEGDICDLSVLKKTSQNVDYILHQAALRSVGRSVDAPLETNDVNITGTLNVLMAAREMNVKRVVLASSSSVYGDVHEDLNVETLPTVPLSPYALTKLADEHYARLFTYLYGLETVALRYFNVFGPYQNPESKYSAVIPIFMNTLIHKKPPTIDGDGNQSRDFTFVDNVVQANIKAATSLTAKSGEAYNIGNGKTTSINELYAVLQELLGTNFPAHFGAPRSGDVRKTQADISKAQRDLGYQPTVGFRDGLIKTLDWYQKKIHSK